MEEQAVQVLKEIFDKCSHVACAGCIEENSWEEEAFRLDNDIEIIKQACSKFLQSIKNE